MKWSLEGIEALEAVADTGSFAAAGEQLHKVPSAVSYQIKALEEGLGVDLFDRSGHRAALTPVGLAMLDEGRFLLARARRMGRLAERFAEGWEARVQVVVDGALPTGPILEALTHLGEVAEATHAQLRTEYLGGVPRRFEELEADLMLTLVPPVDPLLQRLELGALEFVLVAAPTHAAAGVRIADLASMQPHLELSVHDSDVATSALDTNMLPGARVFYVGDFTAKKHGLLSGLGLGWMPLHAIENELASGQLVELDYALGSRLRFSLVMAARVDRPLGRAGKLLWDLFRRGL